MRLLGTPPQLIIHNGFVHTRGHCEHGDIWEGRIPYTGDGPAEQLVTWAMIGPTWLECPTTHIFHDPTPFSDEPWPADPN